MKENNDVRGSQDRLILFHRESLQDQWPSLGFGLYLKFHSGGFIIDFASQIQAHPRSAICDTFIFCASLLDLTTLLLHPL
jgi:hypothetical protein